MDNNDDINGMDGGANGDYGNEDYDGGDNNEPNNNNGNNNGNADGDVDQYFDDAGDIGYLPADHVTPPYSNWLLFIASHATPSKRLDQAVDWWAWKNRS